MMIIESKEILFDRIKGFESLIKNDRVPSWKKKQYKKMRDDYKRELRRYYGIEFDSEAETKDVKNEVKKAESLPKEIARMTTQPRSNLNTYQKAADLEKHIIQEKKAILLSDGRQFNVNQHEKVRAPLQVKSNKLEPQAQMKSKQKIQNKQDGRSDLIDAFNQLPSKGFSSRDAVKAFIQKYGVVGFSCSNAQVCINNHEAAPEFMDADSPSRGDFWAVPLTQPGNLYFVFPNKNKTYNSDAHIACGLGYAFESDFDPGQSYNVIMMKKPAIFSHNGNKWELQGNKKGSIELS